MSEPSMTTLPPQMLKNAKKWAKISGKKLYVYWSPAMGRPMFAEGPPSDPKRFKVLATVSPDGTVKKMHGKKATAVAEADDALFDNLVDLSRGAFSGYQGSLAEGSTKHGQSMSSGFSRDAKLMAPGTRELVLKSRMTEIEAFAEDRGYDPALVFAVAEVAMRMGRVPDLRQYGFAGEDAKAVRHFVAGDILNIAVEDVQRRRAPGCAYGSAGAIPADLAEDHLEESTHERQLGLHPNSDGSGFTALTHSASKTFKSRGGAIRWLKRRGYDEKGGRIKQEDEDWSEIEDICQATALRAPSAAHALADSLSGELSEDRVHRNAAGPAMEAGSLVEDALSESLQDKIGQHGKEISKDKLNALGSLWLYDGKVWYLRGPSAKFVNWGPPEQFLKHRYRKSQFPGVDPKKLKAMAESVGLDEVSPPGWSGTVKAMKGEGGKKLKKYADEPESGDKKDIDNPWALAWYMHKKGAKPHYKPEPGKPKYKAPKTEETGISAAVAEFRAMED